VSSGLCGAFRSNNFIRAALSLELSAEVEQCANPVDVGHQAIEAESGALERFAGTEVEHLFDHQRGAALRVHTVLRDGAQRQEHGRQNRPS
jgi:hypothetical protein